MTLIKWYLERSEEKIPERIELYARQIGKWPERVEIKNHKRRWGSCSQNGIVRLNWKTLFAPVTILDYVIVHELLHFFVPNHGKLWKSLMRAHLGDYERLEEKLKLVTQNKAL